MTNQTSSPVGPAAVPPSFTQADLDSLAWMVGAAARSWARGDVAAALDLLSLSEDFTLMPPQGGPTAPRPADLDAYAERTSEAITGGEAVFDLEQSYASGDLAVLVGVERQHGVIAGLPDRDWSLRLTLVFRRVGAGWRMVHRHADPLVRAVPIGQCAELARGTGT